MTTLILTAHVIACVLLVLIVLLQTGKGTDMGATFGGASGQALFGGTGPASLLSKITTGVAIIFMLTSLTLAYMSSHKSQVSVMPSSPPGVTQPAKTVVPAGQPAKAVEQPAKTVKPSELPAKTESK